MYSKKARRCSACKGAGLTMLLAALMHLRRKEHPVIAVSVVLGGLALFVAVLRFGPHAF